MPRPRFAPIACLSALPLAAAVLTAALLLAPSPLSAWAPLSAGPPLPAGALLSAWAPSPATPVDLGLTSGDATADPVRHAQEMRRRNAPADEVAQSLRRTFRSNDVEVASILREAGYPLDALARGLRDGLRLDTRATLAALRGAGLDEREMGESLRGSDIPARELTEALRADNRDPASAIRLLREARRPEDETVRAMVEGFDDPARVGQALRQGGVAPRAMVGGAVEAGKNASEVAALLLGGARAPLEALTETRTLAETTPLEGLGGLTVLVGTLVSVAGLDVNQTVQTLHQAGYTHLEIGEILRDVHGVAAGPAALAMREAGIPTAALGVALRDVYQIAPDTAAVFYRGHGFPADETTRILRTAYSPFHYAPPSVLAVLTQAGYESGPATAAVSGEWSGFGIQDAVDALESQGLDPVEVAGAALQHASHPSPEEVGEAILQAWRDLVSTGVEVPGTEALAAQLNAALGDTLGLTDEQMAHVIRGAGLAATVALLLLFPPAQIPLAIPVAAEALYLAGYAWDELAPALHAHLDVAAEELAQIGAQLQVPVNAVITSLREIFDITATQTAEVLRVAGYTGEVVWNGLREVFGIGASTANQIIEAVFGG